MHAGTLSARLTAVVLAGTALLCPGRAADPPGKTGKARPANRLAQESSPYLLQHAHNPVNWYPWGPEAFAEAKKHGKLVFLSIGYSSCYWCHVMERESFSNEAVAKLLNEHFVCIKVDREERPDVDNIYQTALPIATNFRANGGWPLSMFLTADGKPIFGGTYWPREDKEIEGQKVSGFKTILTVVHGLQRDKPRDLRKQADAVAEQTAEALGRVLAGRALVELNRNLVTAGIDRLKPEYDTQHGGFGGRARAFRGPKFPKPPYLELLLAEAARTKSDETTGMLTLTLDRMAMGGIYDQLGGGFHRYSTERTWTVPHFEKMLYDNAQLAEVYAKAFRLTKKPFYRRVVQETLAFVAREMTSPDGAFYSALDAETEAEEGRFYVWTAKEIAAALPDRAEADLIRKVYGADGEPNFESKYFILTLPRPLAETAKQMKTTEAELLERLAPVRQKMLEARGKRHRPFLDTKALTAWNGQMIAGYAEAARVLGEPKYAAAAARAADFLLATMRTKEGRLLRSYAARPGQPAQARLNGYLDDYAYFVHGLLSLHDATGQAKWLDEARGLTDLMVELFADKQHGGFFYTSHDHEKFFARSKDQYDGVQPSGNSLAARNLVRLWVKTGERRYRAQAEKAFKAFAATLKATPTSVTTMVEALGMYLDAGKK